MSDGIPPTTQSTGGGNSNQGKWGPMGSTSWWPLGVAGVTAILTMQAATGVDSEKTYSQVRMQLYCMIAKSQATAFLQAVYW